ncbi:MAG: hypothetical protein K2Q06_12865 [Parvularculaceae bacterium]|nr:hypothetical protein [Parvularculaceae bacterium]
MVKFLFGLALAGACLFSFFKMAGVSKPGFDFETATHEERLAWMEAQGRPMKAVARLTMPNGGAPTRAEFFFDHMKNSPERREIEMVVRVNIPTGGSIRYIPDSVALPKLCKNYVATELYDQKIRLIAGFYRSENGKPAGALQRFVVTPSKCAAYVKAAPA